MWGVLVGLVAASTLDVAMKVEADGVAAKEVQHAHKLAKPDGHAAQAQKPEAAADKAESRVHGDIAKQGLVELLVHDIATVANTSHADVKASHIPHIPKGMTAANFGSFLQLVEQAAARHGAHTGARAEQEDGTGADVRAHAGVEEKHEHWQALAKRRSQPEETEKLCEFLDDEPDWTNNKKDAPNAKAKAHYELHNIDERMIWTGMGYTCKAYWFHGWCKHAGGSYCIEAGYEGKDFNFPEKNCCQCGRGNELTLCPNKFISPNGKETTKAGAAVAALLFVLS